MTYEQLSSFTIADTHLLHGTFGPIRCGEFHNMHSCLGPKHGVALRAFQGPLIPCTECRQASASPATHHHAQSVAKQALHLQLFTLPPLSAHVGAGPAVLHAGLPHVEPPDRTFQCFSPSPPFSLPSLLTPNPFRAAYSKHLQRATSPRYRWTATTKGCRT